ncbi:MAG: HEAT repeat domain-containing protein [Rhodopirellula sp. JB044]|uniref:HEAT repeat domain-containing protein n=1 Tax=Rhodopirellula sp. JB044 TaxID=3342844 RepID=UPI00370AE03E
MKKLSKSAPTTFGLFTVKSKTAHVLAGCLACLGTIGTAIIPNSNLSLHAEEVATATDSVPTLVEKLQSDDDDTRWKAARELGRLGARSADAVPALLAAMQDPDTAVRHHAAIALGRIGAKEEKIVEALIAAVGDTDSGVRIAAVNSIRQLVDDPEVIVPMTVQVMEKAHPLFASRMVETIVMRGEKALPFLNAALSNEKAAYWACLAIEELGPVAAPTTPALIQLIGNTSDTDTKVQALLAIAKIGPAAKDAQGEVLKALESSDPSIVTAAAFASGAVGFDAATPKLERTVSSDEPLLALVSRWALAKLHPENPELTQSAVDQLVAALGNDDPSIRLAAAKGLQSLKVDPEILGPRLIAMLNDSDPVVAHNLVDALASLGEPVAKKAGENLSKEEHQDLAVAVLKELGPKAKSAIPDVVEALAAAEGEFRRDLQTVCGQVGPDAAAATRELARSLKSDEESTRISALFALGSIGPQANAATGDVESFMDSATDPFEKLLAAWAISKLAPTDETKIAKIVPVLVNGLTFPDQRVQAEAIMTLESLGSAASSATDALTALANDQTAQPEMRSLAESAAKAVSAN